MRDDASFVLKEVSCNLLSIENFPTAPEKPSGWGNGRGSILIDAEFELTLIFFSTGRVSLKNLN